VRRTCDFEAALPMAEGVESLNVSVATGIALYEIFVRPQRGG
jgi:23S rRNA (guanosine2251-2'-O)-methyltransferase